MNDKINKSLLYGIIILIVIVSTVLAFTNSGQKNPNTKQEFTIRYLTTPTNVASYELAEELGYFKEKGIRLESVGTTFSGPETIIALDSGSVDLAGAATVAVINAIKGGSKFKSLYASNGVSREVYGNYYVLENSSIRTAKDWAGKKIAVNTLGAHLDFVTREYLRKNGLSIKDVQLVVIPDPNLEQVLRQGQTDIVAVGSWSPFVNAKIKDGGGVRVLLTDYEILGDIALGFAGMNRDFVSKNPQKVKDFVEANARAIDWARGHPQEAKELIAKILNKKGGNPESAKYWRGFGVREHGLIVDNDVQFWIDALVREGKLKEGQFKPSDIYTNEYNPYYNK
jgi:ABC-type nitrate/sulfonate/bicarbonate transport system substrate-binding protein